MVAVLMRAGVHAGRRMRLREMRGSDELRAMEGDPVDLMRDLLEPCGAGDLRPGELERVTLSDRDRVLCALYGQALGDRVEFQNACAECGESFEVALSLSELAAEVLCAHGSLRCVPDEDGFYSMEWGSSFRLPTLGDQRELWGLEREDVERELLERCVRRAVPGENIDALMEQVGPVLDLDLSASCPMCESAQGVPFEIQQYFHSALSRERRWLTRETHRLASAYGWTLAEILHLPRSLRREHVALVEGERFARGVRG